MAKLTFDTRHFTLEPESIPERRRLLWDSFFASKIIYTVDEKYQNLNDYTKLFTEDSIAEDVLLAIMRKNVNGAYYVLHQFYSEGNIQHKYDILKLVSKVTNPELIVHAGSDFVVVLSDAEYGLDVWVWNLRSAW